MYTTFNKPEVISTASTSTIFSYGPERSRYKKETDTSEITYYVGSGLYEEVENGAITTQKVFIDDFLLVKSEGTETEYNYIHRDHLGSVVAMSDQDGRTIQQFSFEPFGERNPDNSDYTNRGFTDHEHLGDSGLIHMNGRVYDPVIGRFLSPDPFIQDPYNSQNYNRYSYVLNNPLSATDPSGYRYAGFADAGAPELNIVDPWTPTYTGDLFTDLGLDFQAAFHNIPAGIVNRGLAFASTPSILYSEFNDVSISQADQDLFGMAMSVAPLLGTADFLFNPGSFFRMAGKSLKGAPSSIGVPFSRSSNPLDTVLELDSQGNEIMYRTMSEQHLRILEETGQLAHTGETSLSPLLAYSSQYNGITVRITTKPGTSAQLQEIGIAANEPAAFELPHLSTQTGPWVQTHARFKVEKGQMTTQLGQGRALEIFNKNIIDFEPLY
ncbi:hypothetical protein OLMES_0181 [Oleiphilus messinensis]|uniref:Teneurin-like YD-shell domain-containing protein n=1 Tax=Oleiphilus messinensis TaxID=141451 RepID=A0A1Y0I1E8_9GAMM|nr:RHS repeat-associated core domain-containing protein [Oleiphilus messinensis]ARU54288.1 hypothetical protein OLMES_0181 [Oleiphilus messinensis]